MVGARLRRPAPCCLINKRGIDPLPEPTLTLDREPWEGNRKVHGDNLAPGEQTFGTVVLWLVDAVILFVVIRINVARREWIAWHAKWFMLRFIRFAGAFLLLEIIFVRAGLRGWWVQYVAMVISSPLLGSMPKFQRPRRIPEHIRREVIQEHQRRTGSFDARIHEIDHMVPLSKGGGHTKDNLWVVAKNVNRAKGNKMPMLEDGFASHSVDRETTLRGPTVQPSTERRIQRARMMFDDARARNPKI
jgi:hypothetical protein